MSDIPAYAPGAPAWLDMTVSDLAAAKRFYAALMGWEFDGNPYSMASVGGRRIAGLAQPWEGAAPPERSNWTVYLSTNDIDASLTAARAAGGTVVGDRNDVPGLGSMAVVGEPSGTVFSLWQSETMPGSEASGVPGAPAWSEVTTPDMDAAVAFFVSVFGYETERIAEFEFVTLYSAGQPVFGVYGGTAERVHQGHGAWLPYFTVQSADAASALAQDEGGRVLRAAQDSAYGRWAMLADPGGAHFAVIEAATDESVPLAG